jgi:hypothetical protein
VSAANAPALNVSAAIASGPTKLETLRCYNNPLTKLDVTGLSNLTFLAVGGTSEAPTLSTLDGLSTLTNLKEFDGSYTNLPELDFGGLAKLEYIDASNNTSLQSVRISSPVLKEVNLNDNSALNDLDVTGVESIGELNIAGCESLTEVVGLSGITIDNFTIDENTPLQTFKIDGVAGIENGKIEIIGGTINSVIKGSDLIFNIYPAVGYYLKSFAVNGEDVTEDVSSDGGFYTYAYPNVGENLTVAAEFTKYKTNSSDNGCDAGASSAAALFAAASMVVVGRGRRRR